MQDGASDFVELDGATQVLVNAQLDLKRKVQQQADELILKDEALKTTKKELAELQVLYGTAQAYKDEMSKTLADRYLKILTSTNAIQSDRIALDQQTTALQERADAVDLRCSELEKRESVMNAALQSLHGQEADIRARGQTVDERSRELDERVLIANAHFREIKEQTTVLDGRAEQLRQQAERLQQRGEQLGQQEANMVAWTGEVEEHQRRAQAQHTALLEREQRLDVESGLLNNSMLQFAEKFQLKVEEHQVKAAALQAHIVNTTNKKEQLEAALKSRSEDYNILNQTLIHERNRAQAVIDSTTTKISQHIAKCAEMQEKLDAALTTNDEVRELRAKVADTANHSTTISRLQGDLASEQERIRTLQVELDAARVQLQSAPTATTTADPELEQSYKTKVRDLKKQLRTAQNAADERCEKLKIKLSATVKTHKLEISDLKRTLGQEQAELKAKSAALNKAEESAASRGQAYDALKLRYDALQAECDELQKETDTLRKPAPFDTTTMEALRTKNATHIKKNRALTDQNRGLEAKVRDLEDKVQTLRRANQQLEGSQRLGLRTQQELQTKAAKELQGLNDCNRENAELRAELRAYRVRLAEWKEQAAMQIQNARAHEEENYGLLADVRAMIQDRDDRRIVQARQIRAYDEENHDLRAELNSLRARFEASGGLINRVERLLTPDTQSEDGGENFSDEDASQSGSDGESESYEVLSPSQERAIYANFMKALNFPAHHPGWATLKPVQKIGDPPWKVFRHDLRRNRRSLHCPKRSIWCGRIGQHALVFGPTREYSAALNEWTDETKMVKNCGQIFDFYINQGQFVYYAGIYKFRSLRALHPPGAAVSSDVSRMAIQHAAGVAHHPHKLGEGFPDGVIGVETFGLQCVGFDVELYNGLRAQFTEAGKPTTIEAGGKRKADDGDLRGNEKAKAQRV